MKQIVTADTKPPVGGMGGSIHDWERSLDPWHRDAFPKEFKKDAPNQGVRRKGWMALDAYRNPLMFLPDGEQMPKFV